MRTAWVSIAIVVMCSATAAAQATDGTEASDAAGVAPEGVAAPAAPVPDQTSTPSPRMPAGPNGMPGGAHVGTAVFAPRGSFMLHAGAGYGRRSALLGADHRVSRGLGNFAFAYAPLDGLMFGVALDGRVDKHAGLAAADDGYVGDPRLFVRGGRQLGSLGIAGEVTLLVPGKDAPSFAARAATVDARLIGSYLARAAVISANVGYRLDRSANAVSNRSSLSVADQSSLGLSEFSALLVGAHAYVPFGLAYATAEFSADIYTGSGAPGPAMRGRLGVGYWVTPKLAVYGFGQGGKSDGVTASAIAAGLIPLVPYESTFVAGAGLSLAFGGPARKGFVVATTRCAHPENPDPNDPADKDCPPKVQATAHVSGQVRDDGGQPMAGATIAIAVADKRGSANTDTKGRYMIGDLPIGDAKIDVLVDGKKPFSRGVVLVAGANAIDDIVLETVLPPGELRGVVRAQSTGRPVMAKIEIAATEKVPAKNVTPAADGTFAIELPPGTYTVAITADGYAAQSISVVIPANNVLIKNVDLVKKR